MGPNGINQKDFAPNMLDVDAELDAIMAQLQGPVAATRTNADQLMGCES